MTEPSRGRARAIAALVLAATFAAGAIAGAGANRAFAHPGFPFPGGRPPFPMGGPPGPPLEMFKELDLTAEQQAKVKAIFEANQPRIGAVMRETFPKIKPIIEDMQSQ